MAQFHHPTACVAGLARGRELLRRHAAALAPPPLPLSGEIPRGFLRYMAPADHERYSRLFRAAFSERTLSANREAIVAEARCFLAAWAAGGTQRPRVDRFLLPALARIFFGSLLSPADLEIVERCGRDATFATATGRPTARAKAALASFVALLAARRDGGHDPARDVSVWSELAAREPAALADPTVLGNLFLLFEASRDSIDGLLLWSAKRLGEHPEWQARLRDELAAAGDESDPGAPLELFTCFAFETLRLAQSEYLYRRTLSPIDLDGFTIPRGWLVRICVAESHRLDPPFAEPDRFDPDRHRRRRFEPNELSPFGLDRHACLGARLTLFVSRLFLEELVAGYELTRAADGPPERAPRHWVHWAPSRRLRLALAPRAPAADDPDRLGA
jgi:cytochrome P450